MTLSYENTGATENSDKPTVDDLQKSNQYDSGFAINTCDYDEELTKRTCKLNYLDVASYIICSCVSNCQKYIGYAEAKG